MVSFELETEAAGMGWWALVTIHLESQIAVPDLVSSVPTQKDAGIGGQGFRLPIMLAS